MIKPQELRWLPPTFHLFPPGGPCCVIFQLLSHWQDSSGSPCIVLPLFPTYWEESSTLSEFFVPESKFPERLQMIHLKCWLATYNPSRMGQPPQGDKGLRRKTDVSLRGKWMLTWTTEEMSYKGKEEFNAVPRPVQQKTALEIYQVKLSFQKSTKC